MANAQAVRFYHANHSRILGTEKNRINSLTAQHDLPLVAGEGLTNYVVAYNYYKKATGSTLFKTRADILVLSYIETALRAEYQGAHFTAENDFTDRDLTPNQLVMNGAWTPPAEHMALAAGGNRMEVAEIHNVTQLMNTIDWPKRAEELYRKHYVQQQFILLFGVCKRGHATQSIGRMCSAIASEINMPSLDVDTDSVFIAYQKWAKTLNMRHFQWVHFFKGLAEEWVDIERVTTLLGRCKGMGNTAAHIVQEAILQNSEFNWEHVFQILPGQIEQVNTVQHYINAHPYTFFMSVDDGRPPTGGYKALTKVCQYMLQKGGNGTIGNYRGTDRHTFSAFPTICAAIDQYFQEKVAAAWGDSPVTVDRARVPLQEIVEQRYIIPEGDFVLHADDVAPPPYVPPDEGNQNNQD